MTKSLMHKIGMVGGLAWPSTADYYRLICTMANRHFAGLGHSDPLPSPPMLIESVDISVTRKLRGNQQDAASWQAFEAYFRDLLLGLERNGAQFAFIASNTPHMRLPGIIKDVNMPVNSILTATAEALEEAGSERVLVLGTPVTMRSTAYSNALKERDLEAFTLTDEAEVHELAGLIDGDLYAGITARTREWISAIGEREQRARGIDTICLACTELPLAFPEHKDEFAFECDGARFLNTTVAHARSVFVQALRTPQ